MQRIAGRDVPDRIPGACVCSSHRQREHVPLSAWLSWEAARLSRASGGGRQLPPETTRARLLPELGQRCLIVPAVVGAVCQDESVPSTVLAYAAELETVPGDDHRFFADLTIPGWEDGLPREAVYELLAHG